LYFGEEILLGSLYLEGFGRWLLNYISYYEWKCIGMPKGITIVPMIILGITFVQGLLEAGKLFGYILLSSKHLICGQS
jgi:hypothetical protein